MGGAILSPIFVAAPAPGFAYYNRGFPLFQRGIVMPMFPCRRCKQMSLSLKDKYRAGHWQDVICPNCHARLCATPWVLAAFYILYLWDVAWFSGLFYYTYNPMDFVYMAAVWFCLDLLNIWYMPLSVMRSTP